MYKFFEIIFKNIKKAPTRCLLKKARKCYRKVCAIFLTILTLSINMLCAMPTHNQTVYAEDTIAIDATNFPDQNFRTWVTNNITHANVGYLTATECGAVTSITVTGSQISDLSGIQYFTQLDTLYCNNNPLTALDVSKNLALSLLICTNCQLKTLDVSNHTALIYLYCDGNQLTALDVSNNTALSELVCYNNQLTALDVSTSTELCSLVCDHNQLTVLDVSKNLALYKLYCNYNPLTTLDVSNNTELNSLECNNNQLTALDISNNTELNSLECNNNQLTALDISNNAALTTLYCDNNQLTALDVSNNTALTTLYCDNNQLTALDVSNNAALNFLYCGNNQLTNLDVNNNSSLKKLTCSHNHLTSLNLSNNKLILKATYLICNSQTATARLQNNGTNYYVNMNNVVGSDNLTKVSTSNGTWSYDSQNGIMTCNDTSVAPTSLTYNYDTNLSIGGIKQYMDVTTAFLPPLTVTFHPDNGQDSFQGSVDSNGKITVPTDPTRTNYKFLGWYTSTDGGKTLSSDLFDFGTTVTDNIDLYAKWMCWVEFPDVGAIISANDGGVFSSYLDKNYTPHVNSLDKDSDSYKSLCSQLAVNISDKQINGAKIFDIYFTNENNDRIDAQNFNENIEVYLKVPDGWNYDNMKAFYVTPNSAEEYSMINNKIDSVPYIHITITHFSNYAIVDTGEITPPALATGDNSFVSICIVSSLLLCAISLMILSKKKEILYINKL